MKGIVDALGFAGKVLFNAKFPTALSLPSLSLVNGSKTVLVVNASDAVLARAIETKGSHIFGAYNNTITPDGIVALWNGLIAPASAASALRGPSKSVPLVKVDGFAAVPLCPNNLANPATHVAFFEEGESSRGITQEEGIERLVKAVDDEDKLEVINTFAKSVSFSVIGSPKQLDNLI